MYGCFEVSLFLAVTPLSFGGHICAEADMAKFQQGSDADIFAAAHSLKNMVESGQPQKKIHNYEKALGLNYIPTSLLFDREARERLPPSMLCVDGMHTVQWVRQLGNRNDTSCYSKKNTIQARTICPLVLKCAMVWSKVLQAWIQ